MNFFTLHSILTILYPQRMRACGLIIALLATGLLWGKPLDLTILGEEAILMNAKTGAVLFAKNEHQQAYPASTTKIATALFALHKCRQDLSIVFTAERESVASITPQAKKQSNFRCPPHWLETDGTHVGIKRGEEIQLKDLLHLTLITSANDAANVIAQGIGGTIPKFMEELNLYLKSLGCKDTYFNNPHGLHHPSHITTAYDLALMAKEGLKDPLFCEIVSMVRYTCPKTNLELERHVVQSNQLLKKGPYFYSKAIGIKTGFTQTAGKNLVAAAQDKNRSLIVVALGYKGTRSELYQDVTKMFEAAFNEQKMRRILLTQGEQKLTTPLPRANKPLKTYLAENLAYEFYPSEDLPVKATVDWQVPTLPIVKGTCVGKINIIDFHGNRLSQAPLFASEDLKAILWHQIFNHERLNKNFMFFCAGGVLVIMFGLKLFKKKK